MYLKRLESVGFKSFAERIQVEFVPGVTAVVGPNGSGKSNIIDAIRWVLGEQSAKSLRGSKMEDIIFQGSDTRKPLNVAEVSLVLDNQDHTLPLDYDEVSVTRRVYRSGDSEYYINKQSCRLKDIIDLFMDTGLGRDSFSIISQGKVEEILSSKPEERRTIFEEAAGVLKYKNRKKKAEYKLAETQENLNRVQDIIYEIEQQMNPLEKQAETAEKYLQLKDRLKEEEISLLVGEIETLHKDWQGLLKELQEQQAKELQAKTSIQKKEAFIEEQRLVIDKLDEKIDALQKDLLVTTEQLEKYEGKKQLLHERAKHLSENKQKLEEQLQETDVKMKASHRKLVTEEEKLSVLHSERKEIKEKLDEIQVKLSINEESIAEKIEELKSDYIELLNQQAARRNEKKSIEKQLQQLLRKKEQQSFKFEDLLTSRDESEKQKQQAKVDVQRQMDLLQQKQEALKNTKQTLGEERSSYQQLQTKLYQGYQYLEKIKSKKEMLEEMKDDFQGFYHGVKAVLKAREDKQLEGIDGAVIELIDIPKEYIPAIETVLGGQAQNIIVKNDLAARNAIYWLKKTNRGRATFLPLASIQERFITQEMLHLVKKHPGFIGIAANLVKTNAKYQKAVHHLMGHILVAKTLKDASEIATTTGRKYRVVTLDGDVVYPGGSMSGGAQKKTNQTLFTREKDIQELTTKLHDYQKKIVNFEKKVEHQKQLIKNMENQVTTEEQRIDKEQDRLQQLQTKFNKIELTLRSLHDNLTIYDQEEKQFVEEKNTLKAQQEKIDQDLIEIADQVVSIEQKINMLSKQETELKESRESIQKKLHDYQVEMAELVERIKNQKEKVASVQDEHKELEKHYHLYHSELQSLLEIEREEQTVEEIVHKIEEEKRKKQQFTEEIQENRYQRSTLTNEIQDEERELKEQSKSHQKMVQTVREKEVMTNRLDVELENRLTHLQTEYTITFEKAKQTYEATKNIEASQNTVEQLKLRIEKLGTVNLGAIDEYKRISERYDFLTTQKDDLTEAKATLFKVIQEMDEEMKKLFNETFQQVKEQFSLVFKQLFGGGHAELLLTNPNDLLETGIDIIAQPPGKKLQNLGLLSGGERALTAIALLFSILQVRPVPFCILDEVEAALDEANVIRYAKYLKRFKDTQFIVITHRKGTMEEADVLYGVTMQESGVSRFVSVRLDDTKELINS